MRGLEAAVGGAAPPATPARRRAEPKAEEAAPLFGPRSVSHPWPAPPPTFASVAAAYPGAAKARQGPALHAPGGADGSVVVRWPKGPIAVAVDSGAIRQSLGPWGGVLSLCRGPPQQTDEAGAFYPTGLLALTSDTLGNVSVNDPTGRVLLS